MITEENARTGSGPVRQCAGCNGHFPKSGLIRIVAQEGRARIDRDGKAQCRGVYVCRSESCIRRAQKSAKISRQLGCTADASLFEELAAEAGTVK